MDHKIEAEIKKHLEAFQQAVSGGDGDGISAALGHLDRLTAEKGQELNPRLSHFLQRRSYDKALAFLGGEKDIPAGNCGGKG